MTEFKTELIINELPEDDEFEPIPAGKYVAEIINSDVVSNKNEDGIILKLTIKIVEGDFSGRLIFENLNIENKNEKAQKIALSMLRKLCVAVNFEGTLKNSVELHGVPIIVSVVIKPEQGGYPSKNSIRKFEKYQSNIQSPKDSNLKSKDAPSWLKKSSIQEDIGDSVPF
jgi:hypothetical protein